MTATENNMAYRSADHEKWGQMDFIIGQKIQLSNNHTIKNSKGVRVPFHDICDEMVGDYPKDFKFTGWHPFCRCIVTPILADWNEHLEVMKMRANGEDVSDYHYEGEITEMPEGYNKWIEKNAERIAKAKSLPYWIKDNPQYTEQLGMSLRSNNDTPDIEYNMADAKTVMNKLNKIEIGVDEYGLIKMSEKESIELMSVLFGKEFDIDSFRHAYSGYDRDKDKIIISNITQATSKGNFNPAACLRTFLTKVKDGRNDWNFLHEYAAECTWHEYYHSIGKGWSNNAVKSTSRLAAMETINQFCARMSYKDLLAKFDVVPKFENEILYEGLGYKNGVKNLFLYSTNME